jgi:uncharacterized protein (DUF2147 family)
MGLPTTTALASFAFAFAATVTQPSAAADVSSIAAQGLWMSADKDAVIEFKVCGQRGDSLCGRIVWDKDAGTPSSACGVQIAELNRFADDAWRDGWVFDPRNHRKYKGAVRAKGNELAVRAFVGVEVLGQTETLTRVDALPTKPSCRS